MAIIRVPPNGYLGNGKGRKSRQEKYGPRKGTKPKGLINVLKGNRRD